MKLNGLPAPAILTTPLVPAPSACSFADYLIADMVITKQAQQSALRAEPGAGDERRGDQAAALNLIGADSRGIAPGYLGRENHIIEAANARAGDRDVGWFHPHLPLVWLRTPKYTASKLHVTMHAPAPLPTTLKSSIITVVPNSTERTLTI